VLVNGGKKPSEPPEGDFVRLRKKGLSSFYPPGSLSRRSLKNVAFGYYQSEKTEASKFCPGLPVLPPGDP